MSHTRPASLLLLALIVGSAAAFLRTQQLKLDKSAVAKPEVRQEFSPTCSGGPACRTEALLEFTLREPERISLSIVDESGDTVRTLMQSRQQPKGPVQARWDGRGDDGQLVADGRYRLAVELADQDRTVTVPDPIVVDTHPPTVQIGRIDRSQTAVVIHFLASEEARKYRLVYLGRQLVSENRTRPTVTRFRLEEREPGLYKIVIVAEDSAGNRTPNPPTVPVDVP